MARIPQEATINIESKNGPSHPDLQNYAARRLSSAPPVSSQRAQNNNDKEVPQIKKEQELAVHPLGAEALLLNVKNRSEASQFPGDRLDPAQDLRQCEGPGDVDQGITSFLDFNKYISK